MINKKSLQNIGMAKTHFKVIKAMLNKPIANSILNEGKPKAFLPFSPLVLSVVLEVLTKSIRQEKRERGI